MNQIQKAKVIAEVLKKKFGNLTVAEVLDLAGEILEKLEAAEKTSDARDPKKG